jgi:hypothetical protein
MRSLRNALINNIEFLNDKIYFQLTGKTYILHGNFLSHEDWAFFKWTYMLIAKQHGQDFKHALYLFTPSYYTDKKSPSILKKL